MPPGAQQLRGIHVHRSAEDVTIGVVAGHDAELGADGVTVVASGNLLQGILSDGRRTVVQNARVGVDVHGDSDLSNGEDGIVLNGDGSRIGGPDAPVIASGNRRDGIVLGGGGSTAENILAGVGRDGVTAIPNGRNGIKVSGPNCSIGSAAGERIVVAANVQHGLAVETTP